MSHSVHFQKRAAKHGYSCQLCRPDDNHGRVKPAVITVCGFDICADHLMTLALIVTADKHQRGTKP